MRHVVVKVGARSYVVAPLTALIGDGSQSAVYDACGHAKTTYRDAVRACAEANTAWPRCDCCRTWRQGAQ